MLSRYIEKQIKEDLEKKIVFITGPRQTGKTTLSKSLCQSVTYYNFDDVHHRLLIQQKQWDRKSELIIFDELHKMNEWKRYLKGIYDVEGIPPRLIVTGSAKLDVFRKVGDSLAGRFHKHRLYPFDVKELVAKTNETPKQCLARLIKTSGFPEPYLSDSEEAYMRWRKSHMDVILRQDLLDLTQVKHIQEIETLIQLLRNQVGSPVSFASLARDIHISPTTVKQWIEILENLYLIFRVTPYSKNIGRAIQKSPKLYFYDVAFIQDPDKKLENIVALSLLKELHFIEDTQGRDVSLHYIQNRQGKEVDFCVVIENEPTSLIEVKRSDGNAAKNLTYFAQYFDSPNLIQLVHTLEKRRDTPNGIRIEPMHDWLSTVPLVG